MGKALTAGMSFACGEIEGAPSIDLRPRPRSGYTFACTTFAGGKPLNHVDEAFE
jgi:hypothetical protein